MDECILARGCGLCKAAVSRIVRVCGLCYNRAMTLWLQLAGWHIHIICTSPELAEQAAVRYAAFAGPPAAATDADLTVEVQPADGASAAAPGTLPAAIERGRALLHAPVRVTGGIYLLDAAGIHGRIVPGDWQAQLQYCGSVALSELEYFLRIACALRAFHAGGLLVHAAGLQVSGAVYLFIGQSGSGKSTVVALSQEAVALGDDLILLRPSPDGWQAYGTPFWNLGARVRCSAARCGPLAGIYKLVQDPDVYVEPLPLPVAVAELVANCPVVNGLAPDLPELVSRCRTLACAAPPMALHFRKDPGFWQLIR